MQPMFDSLLTIVGKPLQVIGRVQTDNSVLLIYPPDRELDFREQLNDHFVPALTAKGIPHQIVDLSHFLCGSLSAEEAIWLQEDEFDDYHWLLQGLSKRIETRLKAHLTDMATAVPGANIIIFSTVSVFPLVRFGDILTDLRNLEGRFILAFPGDDRDGVLHFMGQPDGSNYLAVKISWS
jgi:hypothetical protein